MAGDRAGMFYYQQGLRLCTREKHPQLNLANFMSLRTWPSAELTELLFTIVRVGKCIQLDPPDPPKVFQRKLPFTFGSLFYELGAAMLPVCSRSLLVAAEELYLAIGDNFFRHYRSAVYLGRELRRRLRCSLLMSGVKSSGSRER